MTSGRQGCVHAAIQQQKNESINILGMDLGGWSFPAQFVLAVSCLCLVFVPYGYLQESIVKVHGFNYGLYITTVQFFCYAVLSFGKGFVSGSVTMTAPLHTYVVMGSFLALNICFTNVALVHMSYPTKVLFKSSKLVPTLLVSCLFFGRKYHWLQYVSVATLVGGLLLFSWGDLLSGQFSFNGIGYMGLALLFESFGNNYSEKVMKQTDTDGTELLLYNGLVAMVVSFVFAVVMDEFRTPQSILYKHLELVVLLFIMSTCAYAGGYVLLSITKGPGALIAVTTSTTRKFVSIVVSYMFIPKKIVLFHVLGLITAFIGIVLNIFSKYHFSRPTAHPGDVEQGANATETTTRIS